LGKIKILHPQKHSISYGHDFKGVLGLKLALDLSCYEVQNIIKTKIFGPWTWNVLLFVKTFWLPYHKG